MSRINTINHIIGKYEFNKYLEIGIRFPDDCFNHINCELKDSVDPGYENSNNPAIYPYTSDSFFNLLETNQTDKPSDYKWDVIFIDGLHISYQVEKDIQNSLNHLSENGVIILHDCNPPSIDRSVEDFWGQPWNGTVWKAIYKLRCSKPDIDICVLDWDEGVGIIKKGKQKLYSFDNPYFEYRLFERERNQAINLISPQDLNSWLDNPFYV